jgi:hypothetical protein
MCTPKGPGYNAFRPFLHALIHPSAWRNCLENRNVSRIGLRKRPIGSQEPQSAASCRKRSVVQRPSAIFQTVSEGVFCELRLMDILRTSALKLSEKGFEQRSERGFGQCSGVETGRPVLLRCLLRPRFGHLRDFSDSFISRTLGSSTSALRSSPKFASPQSYTGWRGHRVPASIAFR